MPPPETIAGYPEANMDPVAWIEEQGIALLGARGRSGAGGEGNWFDASPLWGEAGDAH